MCEKAPRRRFNIELLNETIQRDSAKLIGNYESIDRDTYISYECKCGIHCQKNLRCIVDFGGAYCKMCCNMNSQDKLKNTYLKLYGVEHQSKIPAVREKYKTTMLERYGSETPIQCAEFKEKIKNTMITKYGVENALKNKDILKKAQETTMKNYDVINPFQSESIKDKIKEVCLEKYGVENPGQSLLIKQRIIDSCIKKFGVEYSMQSPIVRNKVIQTNLERYGVENALQNPEIQEKQSKNMKKFKNYTMPSGNIRRVQGYEPYALDELITIYREEQIYTNRSEVPRIMYTYNEKPHYYFPDIYIPHENRIIEIKSSYTINYNPEIIKLKGDACKERGYLFEIWVYDVNKNKIIHK